jgi:hypothetical protein
MTRPKCLHCRRNKPGHGNRGLCRGCWNDPRVRNRYREIRATGRPLCRHCQEAG